MKRIIAALALAGLYSTSAMAVPVTVADLGSLTDGTAVSGNLLPNEVVWYSFTLTTATYLDITSNGSAMDTEIGLYDGLGFLIASDDDDGFGLQSTLTFGTGSGLALGDPFNLSGGLATGEDGPLGPGTYFIALGEFQTTFADGFTVDSTGTDNGGEYFLTFYTDNTDIIGMPEPGILLLIGLGLAGFGLARRRS